MTAGAGDATPSEPADEAIRSIRDSLDLTRATLASLVAIPGISAASFPPDEVRRSAEAVADTLPEFGLGAIRLLECAGHPAVYGELVVDPAAPFVLVYGHHDVQPPGVEARWLSPPFEMTARDGRLFGRGTADDKGGFLAYLAAVRAAAATSALPCNVSFLIEGEEEIGSPNLAALLEANRELLACDFVVLCDTPNFAAGVPSLTWRLRGNCIVDVEVECLERPVHSGQGGGLVPDSIAILCTILSRLVRDDGSLAVAGLRERVAADPAQLEAMRSLPFDEERWSRDSGLLPGVRLLSGGTRDGTEASSPWGRIWAEPSLTITAIEAVPIARAANQIAHAARARLSLRTVRDLGTMEAGELLADAIRSGAPHGARVSVTVHGGPSWWEADPRHPLLAAGRRALGRGFGADAVMAGSGGSIGFVAPFAKLAGRRPPLLTGVQDPRSNAHSENESLLESDWEHAMHAAVYLFDELARYQRESGDDA